MQLKKSIDNSSPEIASKQGAKPISLQRKGGEESISTEKTAK